MRQRADSSNNKNESSQLTKEFKAEIKTLIKISENINAGLLFRARDYIYWYHYFIVQLADNWFDKSKVFFP